MWAARDAITQVAQKLSVVDLSSNELQGTIPVGFFVSTLTFLNLSGNQHIGPIPVQSPVPKNLERFPPSFKPGNGKLVLPTAEYSLPDGGGHGSPPGSKSHGSKGGIAAAIVVASVVAIIMIVCLICHYPGKQCASEIEHAASNVAPAASSLMRPDSHEINLETSGRKSSLDSPLISSSWFAEGYEPPPPPPPPPRQVGLVRHKKDFATELKKIGSLEHPNIVPLCAYYWGPREQETLLLAGYIQGDSLAFYIQGDSMALHRYGKSLRTWLLIYLFFSFAIFELFPNEVIFELFQSVMPDEVVLVIIGG
ncbi:hypothetical protein MLD38_035657 [Melastoma candidum]|uniref:Uncharacterized protein n=1 Tax=Melastoma candidum TaxID=119954 RepID=A0ACB9LHQ2_9MYRT|nr:hypothetical protein MLD38_035657 [Melastoma candidum]